MTRDPGRLRPLVEEAGALVPGVEVAVGLVGALSTPVVAPVVAQPAVSVNQYQYQYQYQ